MLNFLARRLAQLVPTLFFVSILIFSLQHLLPGDPALVMAGEERDPAVIEQLRKQYRLDQPIPVQYIYWVKGVLSGDFGESLRVKAPVLDLIAQKLPVTLQLGSMAILIAFLIGIPAGILSAVRRDSLVDRFFMGFSLLGVSMPILWSALLMQYIFALQLGWLPVSGFYGPEYVILPAIVLGWSSAGVIARLTRSSLLEVMHLDYIRTARAKGLREIAVISHHALKNALIPVVTIMAIQVAGLLSGAVITEAVFGIPGIWRLSVNAIQARDMPLLQGSVLFATALVILGNLIADILYSILDPRVRSHLGGATK